MEVFCCMFASVDDVNVFSCEWMMFVFLSPTVCTVYAFWFVLKICFHISVTNGVYTRVQ